MYATISLIRPLTFDFFRRTNTSARRVTSTAHLIIDVTTRVTTTYRASDHNRSTPARKHAKTPAPSSNPERRPRNTSSRGIVVPASRSRSCPVLPGLYCIRNQDTSWTRRQAQHSRAPWAGDQIHSARREISR